MKASYFSVEQDQKVRCTLCPHQCVLKVGQAGVCRVRRNVKGQLLSENYGKVCSLHLDPIEKKPLYHFYPGKNIFSVGSLGCNLHCRFCQNWEISQTSVKDYPYLKAYSPEAIMDLASTEPGNSGIAYTYNEPTVWFEFMMDIASLSVKKGMKNVMVTNGFIKPDPLKELLPVMHAFSVDLKAFTEPFYKHLTSSSLKPVLESLKIIRQSGRHLEVTNLLIPGENDDEKDFREMMKWIQAELGPDTVLHISRFFPTYKLMHHATSEALLFKFYEIAREYLNFVYLGNMRTDKGRDTICPECGNKVISRLAYQVSITGLDEHAKCKNCGQQIPVLLPGS